jgi:hypothetical protein
MTVLINAGAEIADTITISGRAIAFDSLLNADIVDEAETLHDAFKAADPFPHIVLDGLFSPDLLDAICEDFEDVSARQMKRRKTANEYTFRSKADTVIPLSAQLYFDTVNSNRFVQFLSVLTGIPALVTDPYLRNGGMHESRDGGKFDMHIDFTKHPVTNLDNRLVMITYLNRGWQDSFGGVLELWNAKEQRCVRKVVPEFGRTIIFEQTPDSLHGHPDPIRTPDGRKRRSLATYFYSNGRDDGAAQSRHDTHFVAPQGSSAWVKAAKYVLPPILTDLGRALRRR